MLLQVLWRWEVGEKVVVHGMMPPTFRMGLPHLTLSGNNVRFISMVTLYQVKLTVEVNHPSLYVCMLPVLCF